MRSVALKGIRMKAIAIFIIMFIVAGCSTTRTPVFQKSDGHLGYEVQESDVKSRMTISLQMRDEVEPSYKAHYALRAIGEECAARGFNFFDQAEEDENHYNGYCYKTEARRALAIKFTDEGLRLKPRKFMVEHLNSKSQTALVVGDEILKFDDKEMRSMAELKEYIFRLDPKEKLMSLSILRKGQPMTFDEPLAELKNSLGDEALLRTLRKEIP